MRSLSALAHHVARISRFRVATTRDRIHIGIDWLESVAFEHTSNRLARKVLIIGVGNTAMDCCRTSLQPGRQGRQGDGAPSREASSRRPSGNSRTPKKRMLRFIINHSPKEFVLEDGKLVGMKFEVMEYNRSMKSGGIDSGTVTGEVVIPCDDVVLAIGQDNAFPWIERDIGIEFDKWDCPVVDEETMMCDRRRRVLRWRLGVRAEEHHLGRRARSSGGDFHASLLSGRRHP